MKKLHVISLFLMASTLIVTGCNKKSGGGSGGGGSTDDGKIEVNFYADYNQLSAKNPCHTVRVKNGSKLTAPSTPEAPMPEFPVFLGWSYKEIINDKKDLWNFSTDVVQTDEPTYNIFGIWVAEGEQ